MKKKKKIVIIGFVLLIIISLILFSWYNTRKPNIIKASIDKKKVSVIKAEYLNDEEVENASSSVQNSNNEMKQENNNTVEKHEQVKYNVSQENIEQTSQNNQIQAQQPVQQSTSTQVVSTTTTQSIQEYRIDYYRENGTIKEFDDHAQCVQTSINYLFTDTVNILGSSCVPTGTGKEKIELRLKN